MKTMAATVGLRFSLVLLLICAVCAKKISQGTQTEPPKKIFDFDALNVRDLMRWLATVVVIVIVGLSDKRGEIRNWQTLESLMMFVEGFGFYFFPEELLAYSVVGTINKFHICMAQCLGSIEVGFSFTTFLLVRNASRDSLVRSSWPLSRVVLYSLCLIIELHTHLTSYTGPQRLTDQNFSAGVSCLGLCIIFTLYHVMRSGGTSRKRTGRLAYSMQTCILLMVIFLFVTSLADLAFPAQALAEVLDSAKADVIITYLIRSNGAFCLAYVIQMIASLRFDDDEDRLAFFKGNFLAIALQIPMIALYQWKDPVFNPYGIYVTGGGLVFMTMLNACALNRCLPSCCRAKAKTS